MIKNKSRQLFFLGIYSSLVLSVIGSIAGSYAWFTYSGNIKTQFHGTALEKSNSLKVGLASEVDLPEASNYGLTKDANSNIYWSEEGISPEALSYFFNASGYAGGGSSEEIKHPLVPVTSGSYETNGVFALKPRPGHLTNNVGDIAKKEQYLQLPLVFQAMNTESEDFTDYEVRLSDIHLRDDNNGTLSQTIRIHIDNHDGENYIFNPNSFRNGREIVGGTLDLDLDGYFDRDNANKEFIYGEYNHIAYSTTPSQGEHVKPINERTVFNAAHQKGSYVAEPDSDSYKTAEYLGKASVLSKKNIASVKDDHYAYTTLTIYEEGWSAEAIEKVIGEVFDLTLTFELFNAH